MRRISESMLTPYVASYLRDLGYEVFREVVASTRIADVLGVRVDEAEVVMREKHGVERLPVRLLLKILRLLEARGTVTVEEILNYTRYSEGYVRRVLRQASPLYLKYRRGRVERGRGYVPFTREIVAVEVKVSRWADGLIQAYDYLYATHRSYLAIYKPKARRIPKLALRWAEEKGVGILTVDLEGNVEELLPARPVGPKYEYSYYVLVESLWAKINGSRRVRRNSELGSPHHRGRRTFQGRS